MPKLKRIHRFGAFLRLYGPAKARTGAVMVLGRPDEPDTPRGFLDELDEEDKIEKIGRSNTLATGYRLHLAGGQRVTLPSLGSTRRLTNLPWVPTVVWRNGVTHTPLVCAGSYIVHSYAHAHALRRQLDIRKNVTPCAACGKFHFNT